MNTIEALRVLFDIAELLTDEDAEAKSTIGDLLSAYDALVPTLDQWPSDAQWFTIDADSNGKWHERSPLVHGLTWFGNHKSKYAGRADLLPIGIDWRLCKWQRPKADR